MREIIRSLILSSLHRRELPTGSENGERGWVVEIPKRPGHGDYSTNAALVLASAVRRPALDLAKEIAAGLEDSRGYVERVEVVPPGFVNFFLNKALLRETIREVVRLGGAYGRSSIGGGESVQVEFVSANPTGPLHVGHGRGAALGDALANILEATGYKVFREYYVNDVGTQMEVLGRSVYRRYLQELGVEAEFPDGFYKGAYIRELANEILREDGEKWKDVGEAQALPRFVEYAKERILAQIKRDLEEFRVGYDAWFRESSLFVDNGVQRVLEGLRQKGLVYDTEGAVWFRSSAFGDEKDRVVVRSDGRTTYLASDIAYHANKFERGFSKLIDIWGADHHGYVPRMRGVIQALGRDPGSLHVLLVQMVSLLRDGAPVSMSTRAGEFVTLREVMEEVGVDAARYIFLMRSSESQLDFDLEVAKRQERENPVYYVQYAHARMCSILREAEQRGLSLPEAEESDLSLLTMREEWELVKDIVFYPEVVEMSARKLEPHHLTFFLDSLAADFHSYYNLGWLDRKARVISEEPDLTSARLLLVCALKTVVSNALGLLGVMAPAEM